MPTDYNLILKIGLSCYLETSWGMVVLGASQSCHSTGDTAFATAFTFLPHPFTLRCCFYLSLRRVTPAYCFSYLLSIVRSFSTGEELLEIVQSNAHVLRLCLLLVERIVFVLHGNSINDMRRFGLCVFVAVRVLS